MLKRTTSLVSMFLIVVGFVGCARNLQTQKLTMPDGQPACSMGEPMVQPDNRPKGPSIVNPGGQNPRWPSAGIENTTARPTGAWLDDAPF